jgi:hypothetical protein
LLDAGATGAGVERGDGLPDGAAGVGLWLGASVTGWGVSKITPYDAETAGIDPYWVSIALVVRVLLS